MKRELFTSSEGAAREEGHTRREHPGGAHHAALEAAAVTRVVYKPPNVAENTWVNKVRNKSAARMLAHGHDIAVLCWQLLPPRCLHKRKNLASVCANEGACCNGRFQKYAVAAASALD